MTAHVCVIPVLVRRRQKDHTLESNLCFHRRPYHTHTHWLKTTDMTSSKHLDTYHERTLNAPAKCKSEFAPVVQLTDCSWLLSSAPFFPFFPLGEM